jgi:hypothetical protein
MKKTVCGLPNLVEGLSLKAQFKQSKTSQVVKGVQRCSAQPRFMTIWSSVSLSMSGAENAPRFSLTPFRLDLF